MVRFAIWAWLASVAYITWMLGAMILGSDVSYVSNALDKLIAGLAPAGLIVLAFVTWELGNGVNHAVGEIQHEIEKLQKKLQELEEKGVDTALDELRWRVDVLQGIAEPPDPILVDAYKDLGLFPPPPH